jgi:ankyrin repeat protein
MNSVIYHVSIFHKSVVVDLLCRRFPLPEDINSQNSEGNTALHWAVLNGHAEVVSRLLEANADVKVYTQKHKGIN